MVKRRDIVSRIPLVKKWLQGRWWLGVGIGLVIVLPVVVYGAYVLAYRGRIYPGVGVAGIELGNKSTGEAIQKIGELVVSRGKPVLALEARGQSWQVDLSSLELEYNVQGTAVKAFRVGRRRGWRENLGEQWQAWFEGVDLPLVYKLDEEKLVGLVATVAAAIDQPAVEPTLIIEGEEVRVTDGEDGLVVDRDELLGLISQRIARVDFSKISLPIKEEKNRVTKEQMEVAGQRGKSLLGASLRLKTDEQEWVLKGKELISFISFEGGFDEVKIASYAAGLAKTIDRPAQDAAFRFENGRVTEFRPGKDGLKLDQEETVKQIVNKLEELEGGEEKQQSISLSLARTKPAIETAQVNSFGIKELLGRGVSTYRGSIASRVHNVGLSARRISGVLVPPDGVFSFNQSVGEVSDQTGYQQAYVIRSGRTVLDDGGGVCQTSTTLFRAVMDAGLPIVERRAHSYRVGYYEQNAKVGLDATVYAPSVDLKFKNDTPGHILVQTIVNPGARTLIVEIYGTSDGRKSQILNHRVWDVTPPPPDLYQDDPTLPAGTVKQIDWSAWGAKVKFDYVVTRNGETIYSKTFYQVYRPWQAVFLRGTAR